MHTGMPSILDFMCFLKVVFKIMLLLEYTRANVTLKCLDVTDTVSVAHVVAQPIPSGELLAANFAFESGVRNL